MSDTWDGNYTRVQVKQTSYSSSSSSSFSSSSSSTTTTFSYPLVFLVLLLLWVAPLLHPLASIILLAPEVPSPRAVGAAVRA